ncbi:MAG: diacylglycerol kinase [Spirochaetes bacterium]|nr:diacylglycerol kinase [Spirochaetota bacterium]
MKYFIIFNPASRNGRSISKKKKILSLLKKFRIDYDISETKSLDEAYKYSLEANKNGYDVISVIGGDGTINRVINGFYDSQGKRISKTKLAVIHTGTSPDFCKSYNIPTDFNEAFNTMIKNYSKKIKIGKINFLRKYNANYDSKFLNEIKDTNDNIVTGYFGCCANAGLGAGLAKEANSGIRKYFGDFLGTLICLIKILVKYKPDNFSIKNDDNLIKVNNLLNLSVGKTFYIASGIKVKNDLTDFAERFYFLLSMKNNFLSVFDIISKVYSGNKIISNKNLSLSYCRKIEIAGNNNHPELEFDGDPQGYLPCFIKTAEEPLDLIVKE